MQRIIEILKYLKDVPKISRKVMIIGITKIGKDVIKDFAKRHITMYSFILIALLLIGFTSEYMKLIYSIIGIVMLNVVLSSIAVYTYTEINLKKASDSVIVIGLIYLGTAILTGLVVFGTYYLNFIR